MVTMLLSENKAMGDNDTAEHMLDPEKDSTHEFMMFENFNCEKQA